jgi:uncharacterized protein YlxP (DUF503 family)
MIIGYLELDLHFPHARSLKDKRRELAGIKDRIRQRHNVAVAELDFQDTWQRAKIGVAALSGQQALVEQVLAKIRDDVLGHLNGELLSAEIRYY